MDIHEKMWNTLKAESGYRTTLGCFGTTNTLSELMARIEKRAEEELNNQETEKQQ